MRTYIVKQGEILAQIVHREFGTYDCSVLLDFAKNKGLFATRTEHLLREGDVLFLPDVEESQPKGMQLKLKGENVFRLGGRARQIAVRLLDDERKPLSNEAYTFSVDGSAEREGVTDAKGYLRESVPLHAKRICIRTKLRRQELGLGVMDPVHTVSGVQRRLNNLGYHCGAADGVAGPSTQTALRMFQENQQLAVDGIAGDETRARLAQVHGE